MSIGKKTIFFIPGIAVTLLLCGCVPKTVGTTVSDKESATEECLLKNEICAEALDFQKEYDRMPDEEKKDMIAVLNTYIEHCEEATKRCEQSRKRR